MIETAAFWVFASVAIVSAFLCITRQSPVASALWLVQLTRWCHRFFTYNYRLTTRFLYVDRGFLRLIAQRFALEGIDSVEVRSSKVGAALGVGDVWVFLEDPVQPAAVLEGLVAPQRAVELIRDAVRKAREINP